MIKEEKDYAISGLLIRGNDESGFEHVYNQQTFIKKITVDAEKNSGKFDVEDVRINLQRKIKELTDVKTK